MKIAIVDDEELWRTKTEQGILEYKFVDNIEIEKYASGENFLKQRKKYDIVFLDVEMRLLDGFETASKYRKLFPKVVIIILTTHTELSRKGYMVNAFRYIDKSNIEREIEEALTSAELLLNRNQVIDVDEVGFGTVTVVVSDIYYVETVNRSICVHTREHDYISNAKIGELENKLTEYGFFRCHKSYVVNLDKIRTFDKTDIQMKDGSCIMVSARRHAELKRQYLDYKFKYANS